MTNQTESVVEEQPDVLAQLLWADVDSGECFPEVRPHLGHYTSVSTLESIVRNEELWLSHPMLMNDYEELRWGMLEGRRIFLESTDLVEACGSPERYQILAHNFNEYFNRFDSEYSHDVYVGCFCRHDPLDDDGLLSMWRAYGANGGGVAIVFDTGKLTPREETPLVLHPVTYLTTGARLDWIDGAIATCTNFLKSNNVADHDIYKVAWHYFHRLKHFALFTKHKGFSEECEWRLVYTPDMDHDNEYTPMLGYSVTAAGIQPKLKLKLGSRAPLAEIVQTILLGPTASSFLSQLAVKRMLKQLNRPELADRVRICSTPFRPV